MNTSQEKNSTSKSFVGLIIAVLIVSFITSGVVGGIMGAVSGGLSSEYLVPWFKKNILKESVESLKEEVTPRTIKIEEESATVETVKKVSPSVVSIVISKDLSKYYSFTGPNIFPFDDFFEFNGPDFQFSTPQLPKGKQEIGGGTGFIISSDGMILTNKHVVSDPEAEYSVITSQGKKYDAKVLASDPFNDIAIVKIEEKDLPPIELGDSDNLEIGQTVIAIGFVLAEYENTVTKGVISGIGRSVIASGGGRSEKLEGVIQTDAAINFGNSGGPLLNLSGQVIGVNTAINREGQLVSFAIPINSAKQVIESVKKYGKIIRPFLGIRYIILNKEITKANNLKVDYGALIIRGEEKTDFAVIPGSPANKAGLEENDIILEINDQKIDEKHDLARQIVKYKPGDKVELKILHKGEEKTIKVKLEEWK